jgi:hypothetical protein
MSDIEFDQFFLQLKLLFTWTFSADPKIIILYVYIKYIIYSYINKIFIFNQILAMINTYIFFFTPLTNTYGFPFL